MQSLENKIMFWEKKWSHYSFNFEKTVIILCILLKEKFKIWENVIVHDKVSVQEWCLNIVYWE